ncbi:MAG: glycoside hydrolase family 1 protein [Candidatus Dormibacteria bacterium]
MSTTEATVESGQDRGTGARLFPPDFLLGCASAAHQVEGGIDNDWSRWEREDPARIRDGNISGLACDHYRRYREDLEVLAALHQNAHRFSVEWARVEPEEGRFDSSALDHYADVVATCRRLGMEPIVTLHHFTLPPWLAARGGVLARDAPRLFARFAASCVEAFGAQVTWWITINEPTVLAVMAYLEGKWPPGERSMVRTLRALGSLVRMHAAAARAVRRTAMSNHGRRVMISIAHHERRLRPGTASHLERLVAVPADVLFNRWFLRMCMSGRLLPPVGSGRTVPGLAGSLDYVGLNHYCDEMTTFDRRAWGTLFARISPLPGLPTSTYGWAIEPDGMRRALEALWQEFHLPIMITENGVADTDDELRPSFLIGYLTAVQEAMERGVEVRGYLHWTSMDNFEWAEGYAQRFGLFAVDRETMERRRKPSADLYAEICRTRLVPAAVPANASSV